MADTVSHQMTAMRTVVPRPADVAAPDQPGLLDRIMRGRRGIRPERRGLRQHRRQQQHGGARHTDHQFTHFGPPE